MSDNQQRGNLRRVGALWKPKPGGKSLGSGSITINGSRQRFVILRNDRKRGDRDPDYLLMSGDAPEADMYAREGTSSSRPEPAVAPARTASHASEPLTDDDIPF